MFESKIKPVNLKAQVISEILRYIRTMDLTRDSKLPREEELCKILGTSRVTLRAALDELSAQGVVLRKHGKGTFANPRSLDIKVSFNPVLDFYSMITRSGFTPTMRLLDSYTLPVSPALAAQMQLTPGQPVWVSKKIFYADGKFCAYVEDFLNAACLEHPEQLDAGSFHASLFPLLEKQFQIRIAWDKVEIGAVCSNSVPALAGLGAQGVPPDSALLLLRGMSYDSAERPILYAEEYIDTGVIRFNQIRKRQTNDQTIG